MKIITEPGVYLVGKQTLVRAEMDRFLDDEGHVWATGDDSAGEQLAEIGGRLCYGSYSKPRPGGNPAYLHHIKEVGHGSVLEHGVWNFVFTGISRSLSHELVRHRPFSFSQLSQRYVDESAAEYVEPDIIANDAELHAIWLDAVKHAHQSYVTLAEKLNEKLGDPATAAAAMLPPNPDRTTRRKAARQAARSVLPNATETKVFATANARALRHAIEARCSRHADTEIRKLFGAIWMILVDDSPNIFGDYRKVALPDGTFELVTDFKKV